MSTPIIEKITNVEDKALDKLAKVKEPVAEKLSKVVGKVDTRVEKIPTLPKAEKIPTPRELVDSQFAFLTRLLDTEREILVAVFDALSPITNKLLDRKPVKAAAAKPAAAA